MRRYLQKQRKVMTGEDQNSNSGCFTSSRERIDGACRGSRRRAGAGIDGDRVVDEPSKVSGEDSALTAWERYGKIEMRTEGNLNDVRKPHVVFPRGDAGRTAARVEPLGFRFLLVRPDSRGG
jgi:hypothetical protein